MPLSTRHVVVFCEAGVRPVADIVSLPAWLRRRAPSSLRGAVRRGRIKKRRIPGPPPAADPEVLADIAQRLLGGPARSYQHATVSGYKEGTAFVVWLNGSSGQTVSLVFKDVDLSPEGYPAVVGFPGRPGLPEAGMYGSPTPALEPFLPKAHAHVELKPDEHYQYFLEDLNTTYRWGFNDDDMLWAVDRLLEVSSAVAGWIEVNPDAEIIRYDGDFPEQFVAYAKDALSRFADRTGEAHARDLIDRWDAVAGLYLDETPDLADDAVHGDYRRDNLFHHRTDPTMLKGVDWEFSGWGWLHNDLASLLKMASSETARTALERVSDARPQRSYEEHRRLYERCRLERGLLDAALVANQRLAMAGTPTLSLTHFERISDAQARLTGQGVRSPAELGGV